MSESPEDQACTFLWQESTLQHRVPELVMRAYSVLLLVMGKEGVAVEGPSVIERFLRDFANFLRMKHRRVPFLVQDTAFEFLILTNELDCGPLPPLLP